MNIERVAVSTVELEISKSDYLESSIHTEDKEPSWDGDIKVYKSAKPQHSKGDLLLSVPVQVKGKISKDLSRRTITYPIEIADMKNYLQGGGVVYFVVLIKPSGAQTTIYYVNLLPYELKEILSKYGSQKTKNVALQRFPTEKNELTSLFLNVARDMKRQKAAISISITPEELEKRGQLEALSISYTDISPQRKMPFEYLFEHGVYLYAKLPVGLEVPIGYLDKLETAKRNFPFSVTVRGKEFYSRYSVIYKNERAELCIGKSTKLIVSRNSIKQQQFEFTLAGTLNERICDLDFIISALSAKQFEIQGKKISLTGTGKEDTMQFVKREQTRLEELKKIRRVLDKLDACEDLDCSKLTSKDDQSIQMLKRAILDGEAVPLKVRVDPFTYLNVANLKLIVSAIEQEEGRYNIYSWSDAPVIVKSCDVPESESASCFAVFLKKKDFLQCSNINFDKMLESIQNVPVSVVYSNQVTTLLLEMLLACDESDQARKEKLMTASLELSKWLKDNDPHTPKAIRTLNYCQAVKRIRNLNGEEVDDLLQLVEREFQGEDVLTGAYLLLGNQPAAQAHFNRMSESQRETFCQYPIFRFWQGA